MTSEERRKQKQAQRDQDAADLASGKKTREQLAEENGAFAFPESEILWDQVGKLA